MAETIKTLKYKSTHIGNRVAWQVSAKKKKKGISLDSSTIWYRWTFHAHFTCIQLQTAVQKPVNPQVNVLSVHAL